MGKRGTTWGRRGNAPITPWGCTQRRLSSPEAYAPQWVTPKTKNVGSFDFCPLRSTPPRVWFLRPSGLPTSDDNAIYEQSYATTRLCTRSLLHAISEKNQQVEIGTDPMYEKYGSHAMTRLPHQSNLIN